MEIVLYVSCVILSIVGIYLNLAYQRATHRSTVYARFTGRNLRFLSLAQIGLAFSNVVFTAAMWGTRANRSTKSEAFFSVTLSLTRALPAATMFWVTVERIMFNRIAAIRDTQKFRYIAVFRVIQVLVSVLAELVLRASFESSGASSESLQNTTMTPDATDNPDEDGYVKSSLIANYYYDYYHGFLFVFSFLVSGLMFHMANGSHTRAGLLGGMRNDQKIQNLRSQLVFFKRSWLPLFAGCFSDFILQVIIKRVLVLDDMTHDVIYLTFRSYLPIIYPIALIAFHRSLRADYIANFILCRKARNLHKESKVKVIATRESQESIIANLKMIGILSDVETNAAGAAAAMMGGPVGGARPASAVGRVPIAKDPMSNSSMGSMVPKASTVSLGGGGGGAMMFHTRPKNSVPSMGSVG